MPSRHGVRQKQGDSVAAAEGTVLGTERTLQPPIDELPTYNLPAAFAGWLTGVVDSALVEEVILFGSRVRGDHRPDSDIDLLIITTQPNTGPGFRAFYRQLRQAAEAFGLEHRPITIGWPLMIVHRSRVKRQVEEGGIELFEALRQGIQVYPHIGKPSLHRSEMASFDHRRAAARFLALAREFLLDAENGRERLPASHPLAERWNAMGPSRHLTAKAARLAIKAAMWSGMFSLRMHPGSYSLAFTATTLGWPASSLLDGESDPDIGQLMAAARECVERAAEPLSGMKLPRLTYAEHSRAEVRLEGHRPPSG